MNEPAVKEQRRKFFRESRMIDFAGTGTDQRNQESARKKIAQETLAEQKRAFIL